MNPDNIKLLALTLITTIIFFIALISDAHNEIKITSDFLVTMILIEIGIIFDVFLKISKSTCACLSPRSYTAWAFAICFLIFGAIAIYLHDLLFEVTIPHQFIIYSFFIASFLYFAIVVMPHSNYFEHNNRVLETIKMNSYIMLIITTTITTIIFFFIFDTYSDKSSDTRDFKNDMFMLQVFVISHFIVETIRYIKPFLTSVQYFYYRRVITVFIFVGLVLYTRDLVKYFACTGIHHSFMIGIYYTSVIVYYILNLDDGCSDIGSESEKEQLFTTTTTTSIQYQTVSV